MKVLVFVDYYLPGYKGGGPVHSVSRLIGSLKSEFEFAIFTRDRDLGDTEPYSSVKPGTWNRMEDAECFYATPDQLTLKWIRRVVRQARPDVIYVNSYFSKLTRSVLLLRALGRLKRIPIIVAPRGEFSPGALQIKSAKKRLYLRLAELTGLHSGLTWQVSSLHELADARAAVTVEHHFIKAPDIRPGDSSEIQWSPKDPGSARFVFISRLSRKKNLLGAIRYLATVRGSATLTIYGPIEDDTYWSECERAIASLPDNVECIHAGSLHPDEVPGRLREHHFFLFPTLGENFGHVIAEALANGCPALLSDQTPWLDLEEFNAGWVSNLDEAQAWVAALQACVDMGADEFQAMSRAARAYVERLAASTSDPLLNKEMFLFAASQMGKAA